MLLEGETLNEGNNYGTNSKTIHYIQKEYNEATSSITRYITVKKWYIENNNTNKMETSNQRKNN